MVLEFEEHRYVDIDKVRSLQWIEEKENKKSMGVIILDGDKFFVLKREQFDIIEKAFIFSNKTCMYDDKLKKIRWIKGEK